MGSGMLMMVLVPAFLMLVMVVLGIVGLREMRRGAQLEARGRRTEGRVIFDPDQPEVFVAPENGERVSRTGPLIKVVVAVVGVLVIGGFILGPALFLAVLV